MMMSNTSNNDEKYPARISSKGSNVVLNPLQCCGLVPKSYVMLTYTAGILSSSSSIHQFTNINTIATTICIANTETTIMSNMSTCIARCLLHAQCEEARRTNPVLKKKKNPLITVI